MSPSCVTAAALPLAPAGRTEREESAVERAVRVASAVRPNESVPKKIAMVAQFG